MGPIQEPTASSFLSNFGACEQGVKKFPASVSGKPHSVGSKRGGAHYFLVASNGTTVNDRLRIVICFCL